MARLAVVKALSGQQAAVFTTQQLAVILGRAPASLAVTLNRLVASGTLIRPRRGTYCLPDTPVLAIASGIRSPSYISLLAALEHHGLTTQSPRVIDVISAGRSARFPLLTDHGLYEIRLIKTRVLSQAGYEKTELGGKRAFIATLEQAIIDGLRYPRYLDLEDTFIAMDEGVDKRAIIQAAKRVGDRTLYRRLGYLLQESGHGISQDTFGPLGGGRPPLDPGYPIQGAVDPVWRVIVNRRLP